jgi:Tfp pilus assembly protein PilN
MKAVNLIPSDAQRSGGAALKLAPATYALLGVLVAAVALVTFYVATNNSVTSRKAQIADLQSQLTSAQNEANQLTTYATFVTAAQQRVQTVEGIANTRFDWHQALGELAQVVPANTALQTVNATVVPGAGSGGSGGNGLRADLPGPAFEITGCTSTQDDVARLVSRLRTMPDVTRVGLSSATKSTATSGGSSTSTSAVGCAGNAPTFQIVVFFKPVNGAGPSGATAVGTSSSTSTTTTGGTS